jgi:hypothetical protein
MDEALWLLLFSLCLLLIGTLVHLAVKTFSVSPSDGRQARIKADARADALLRDLLDEREYRQLMDLGYIDVSSPSDPQCIYRIPLSGGMVQVYQQGRATCGLCVQPITSLPQFDVIVMHKLLIEGDEQVYLARARSFPAVFPNQRYRP